jgi:NodT family efflux transporter outer membrane factor (OMF) lipoprotein
MPKFANDALRAVPRPAGWAFALVLPLLMAACAAPGPDRPAAAALTPAALGLAESPSTAVQAQWWQQLGSAELNRLVALALQDHPSVAAARARFAQAGALVAGQGAASGAQAGLAVDVSRQLYTENGLYPPPIAGHVYNNANVQAGVSWNPDWFGLRVAEEAATLDQALAARTDAAVVAQALATQVSRVYVGLARLNAQHQLLGQMQAERQHMLALTRQRLAAGLDTRVELTQAQAPLPDLRQQLEGLTEQMDLARHQLAALTAQPAAALQALSPPLAELKLDTVPTALGTDLLGRRPDVVAARWRVEAAAQDVKVARAQFYPNINLVAFVGLNTLNLDKLLRPGSLQAGVAPALRLPLFDGGLLRARLQGRQAATDAAIANYNTAVLDAVREASDALTSVQSLQRQREQQAAAQGQAAQAHALAQQRHQAGLTGLMPVLQAQLQVLQQQRNALDLQARDLDSRVLLMKALGGGWTEEAASVAPVARTSSPA